jgi:hypothetical protein
MAVAADGVDINVNDSFDQAYLQNVLANLKILMDNHMSHIDSRERENDRLIGVRGTRSEDFQGQVNQLFLDRFQRYGILFDGQVANQGSLANLVNNNAAAHSVMVNGGLMTRPDEVAESVIGKAQADTASDVASQALRDAVANVAQTSAAAQGTTGVAQGALQTAEPIWLAESLSALLETNKALGAQIAKLGESINVLMVRETKG